MAWEASGKQVLRLRSWFASRTSYCAQDDSGNGIDSGAVTIALMRDDAGLEG